MNLSMKIPKMELELDEETVVGVDLGIAIPAYCALNNNTYSKKVIGSARVFKNSNTAAVPVPQIAKTGCCK